MREDFTYSYLLYSSEASLPIKIENVVRLKPTSCTCTLCLACGWVKRKKKNTTTSAGAAASARQSWTKQLTSLLKLSIGQSVRAWCTLLWGRGGTNTRVHITRKRAPWCSFSRSTNSRCSPLSLCSHFSSVFCSHLYSFFCSHLSSVHSLLPCLLP